MANWRATRGRHPKLPKEGHGGIVRRNPWPAYRRTQRKSESRIIEHACADGINRDASEQKSSINPRHPAQFLQGWGVHFKLPVGGYAHRKKEQMENTDAMDALTIMPTALTPTTPTAEECMTALAQLIKIENRETLAAKGTLVTIVYFNASDFGDVNDPVEKNIITEVFKEACDAGWYGDKSEKDPNNLASILERRVSKEIAKRLEQAQ